MNATIDSNPPFAGKERHLLRATLARIFCATSIIPKGLFTIDEDTNEMKFDEEFKVPDTETLRDPKSWGNLHQIILKNGRTTHLAPDVPEEEQEAALADLEASDPTVERFRDISEHTPIVDELPSWTSKVCGDTQLYNTKEDGVTVSYAVNVLKSLRWPGSTTVAKSGKFTTIYVGYGLKRGDPSYNPIEPPSVQKDPEEEVEKPEPNPLQEPPIKDEVDTDAEKEGEGEDE